MKRAALLALACCLALAPTQARAELIDTVTGWDGTTDIIYVGEPDTATYGQTITVGAANVLNSFSFKLRQYSDNPVKFQGYVMAWDDSNSRATGPVLYASSEQQTAGTGDFETFTFNTGGLTLTPGSQYVLFLNTSNNFDGVFDEAGMASRADGDAYAGGLFVFLNHANDFGRLTIDPWSRDWQGPGYDAAFTADLSVNRVPEPGSIALLATGFVGLAGAALRRRTRRA